MSLTHISTMYMSLLCSPIPPKVSVLPPSAQWSMSWVLVSLSLCSRGRTDGGEKTLQLVLGRTLKNSSDGQRKHGTRHPNGKPYGCCYCSVKCFPRWSSRLGGEDSKRDTMLKMRNKGQTEVMRKMWGFLYLVISCTSVAREIGTFAKQPIFWQQQLNKVICIRQWNNINVFCYFDHVY